MLQKILKQHINIDEVIEDFVDGFLYSNSNTSQEHLNVIKNIFIDIIKDILNNSDSLEKDCIKLTKLNILNDIPYAILINELNYLKKRFLTIFVNNSAGNEMLLLYEIYFKIEKYVAKEYLNTYLNTLSSNNSIRLKSLDNLIEVNLIEYYKQHLIWLNSLVESIKSLDNDIVPELDSHFCAFGYWLIHDAKGIIKINSEYENLLKRHEKLHNIATLIVKQFNKDEYEIDYHALMTYVESCELLSLSIGTELALLDSSNILKKIEKDELTGALNYASLTMLFKNQYEISLATDSSFILAICDLDNYKSTNDTYGKKVSDKLLTEFVGIAKTILRDSDIIMRYGKEKIMMILLNSNSQVADEKLNQIRINLENFEFKYKEDSLRTRLSVGYIEIKPPNDTVNNTLTVKDYINSVERKLLEAQLNGKNNLA